MNFKKIELHGFKSFADKIEIDFESGITCIVGPNGCGKSNVADAIRWVLGEQSAKTLRGRNMQDIIFSGTTNRKSLSYSEVSLYFDNEDRTYAIDFNEIVVTRKLYRSGESEYYVNGSLCRLKDIIELFRDTGIGREGYSIIGQGKIDDILSVKPDDRRAIFEEAAGISKYRAKKIETERKLKRTEDNLNRLSDILTIQKEQLEPLAKSAENTKKVKELESEMKVLDINAFLFQCGETKTQEEKNNDKLKKIKAEFENKKIELEQVRKKYNSNTIDIANTDNFTSRLSDQRVELLLRNEKISGESKVLSEKLRQLNENLQKYRNEEIQNLALIKEKREDLDNNVIAFEEKNKYFIENGIKLIKAEKEFRELETLVTNEETQIEKSSEALQKALESHIQIKTDVIGLTGKREMLLEAYGQDKDTINQYKKEIEKKDKQLESLAELFAEKEKEKQEKAAIIRREEEKLLASKEDLIAFENKAVVSNRKIVELETSIKMLKKQRKDMQGYQPAVRRLIAEDSNPEYKKRIAGVVGEIIEVSEDYQLAIEIALGASIQNIITDTSMDASYLIDVLKKNGYGRATFMPIDNVRSRRIPLECERVLDEEGVIGLANELIGYERKFEGIIGNLLGNVIIVEDKEYGIKIAKKYKNAFRIVTLDGEHFATSGAITGGSAIRKDTQLLSQDSKIKELEDIQRVELNKIKDNDNILKEIKQEITELSNAIKVLEAQLHKYDIEIVSIMQNINSENANKQSLEDACNKLLAKNESIAKQLEDLDNLIKVSSAKEGVSVSQRQDVNDYIRTAREALQVKKSQLNSLRAVYDELKLESSTLKTELDNIEEKTSHLKYDIQRMEKTLLDLNAQIKTTEKTIIEAQNAINTTVFAPEEREKIASLEKEIAELKEHKIKTQQENEDLDERKNSLNDEINELSVDIAKAEAALERLLSEVEILAKRIEEEYNLTFEDALAYKNEELLSRKSLVNATKLRKEIEKIGPINALAIEEYEHASKRYTEDKTQFDDMEKARQDMLDIIADLTKEMEVKFSANFEKVNQNFANIFKELFGGGQGTLELDQKSGESILEAGIEIHAAPPGKRLQNITLLSGGERALTAIAILFAIIELKPMPFCVLDEIEAALDDANATLFARYLRKFSERTQFIVITHRKPTMELADVLYGVTMQEKGVSKMVSVRLEEAMKNVK